MAVQAASRRVALRPFAARAPLAPRVAPAAAGTRARPRPPLRVALRLALDRERGDVARRVRDAMTGLLKGWVRAPGKAAENAARLRSCLELGQDVGFRPAVRFGATRQGHTRRAPSRLADRRFACPRVRDL